MVFWAVLARPVAGSRFNLKDENIWGVPEMGYLQIIHFNGIVHYKPSILGYPHLIMETPICTLFTELTRSNHKVLTMTSWRSPRYHHWSLHSRCFHHLGTSMDWFRGKFTGKPCIAWKNRWFPVKIFPTNPVRTLSHCGWGIPIFVGEPWNAMHTPFETGFVGVRGPFQGVTAYSGFKKGLVDDLVIQRKTSPKKHQQIGGSSWWTHGKLYTKNHRLNRSMFWWMT